MNAATISFVIFLITVVVFSLLFVATLAGTFNPLGARGGLLLSDEGVEYKAKDEEEQNPRGSRSDVARETFKDVRHSEQKHEDCKNYG